MLAQLPPLKHVSVDEDKREVLRLAATKQA
jgi:hypothetical protein